jgi:uncharacterized membrane protein YgcG
MKKIGRIVLFFLLVFLPLTYAYAVAYPEHQNRFVNDFAGILDEATKDRIETSLRNFEKQTTNEIAVAIVPDLQGEEKEDYAVNLFKKWGIGKKGKDNGLLLLIAIKERIWKIEVGYGLEGNLTDAQCGDIGRNYLVPHFKKAAEDKAEYGRGIEEALGVVMNTLAPPPPKELTPEEKQQQLEQKKRDQEAMEKLKSNIASFLFFVIIAGMMVVASFVIVGFFQRVIERRRKYKALKKKIEENLQRRNNEVEELKVKMEKAEILAKTLPAWIVEKTNLTIQEIKKMTKQVEDANKAGEEIVKSTVPLNVIANLLQETDKILEKACKLANQILDLPDEIKRLREDADKAIINAKKKIEKVEAIEIKMTEEGYDTKDLKTSLSINADALDILRKNFLADCDPTIIENAAGDVFNVALGIGKKLKAMAEIRANVNSQIPTISNMVLELISKEDDAGKVLEKIRKGNPKEVWGDLETNLSSVKEKVSMITGLLKSAEEKNSMKTQKFSDAAMDIGKAQKLAEGIKKAISDVEERDCDINFARESCEKNLVAAEEKLREAKEKVSHKDVKEGTKRKIQSIESAIRDAKEIKSSVGLINWIALAAVIIEATQLASQTIEVADSDIQAAKLAREKAAQELEEEERRRRRRRDEESRRNSYNDNSLSGGGGGGISFGGGGSGGGGAGGKW